MKGFETLLGLLFASALLAALARKVRLPVPIVMVLGGVAAAFAPVVQELAIDPDVAFAVFVPPLLFRAATTSSVREVRDHLRSVALLAVGLVLATTVVVAAVARYAIPGIAWPAAFVLGAVLSPPDAVVSIARAQGPSHPRQPRRRRRTAERYDGICRVRPGRPRRCDGQIFARSCRP